MFNQAYEETKRYRDLEWKTVYWTVGLLAAIVTASRLAPIVPDHKVVIQTLLFLFILAVTGYGAWHIHYIHRKLTWNRNIRRRCQIDLGLFDLAMSDGRPCLPAELRKRVSYSLGLTHLISWWGLMALTAIYTGYCVIYMK
jgi:hypothetical protein